MPPKSKKAKRRNLWYGAGGVLLLIVVVAGVWLSVAPQSPFVPAATPTTGNTTFKLISYQDGEDVSDFVEMSVWIPKSTAEFDETEDIFTISNFEEDKSSMDAEDISIDLSEITYAWIQIDPDTEAVFSENWHLLYGGANYLYTLYVYDLSTDVNFNLLDADTMAIQTMASALSGEYIFVIDVPHATETAAQLHMGTHWDMEQSDFDDLSTADAAEFYKEELWTCQAPLYVIGDDNSKRYDDEMEQMTNAFALMLDFNDTVSTTDGALTQVNVTLVNSNDPVEIITSGDKIYLVFYEVISFENGAYTINLDLDTAANITLTDVDSGRIVVPEDDDNLGTFTKLSDIGA
jgi:hypothetical protein